MSIFSTFGYFFMFSYIGCMFLTFFASLFCIHTDIRKSSLTLLCILYIFFEVLSHSQNWFYVFRAIGVLLIGEGGFVNRKLVAICALLAFSHIVNFKFTWLMCRKLCNRQMLSLLFRSQQTRSHTYAFRTGFENLIMWTF